MAGGEIVMLLCQFVLSLELVIFIQKTTEVNVHSIKSDPYMIRTSNGKQSPSITCITY